MDHTLLLFTAFSHREWFLLITCAVIYLTLFIVTVQNSRRKVLLLKARMEIIKQMQTDQQVNTQQHIAQNRQEIEELQRLIRKLGDENTMLKLELEERKAKLDYNNKVAEIEREKRSKADSIIFTSPIYVKLQDMIGSGQSMSGEEQSQLDKLVNAVYTDFTGKLYSLYRMTNYEYAVCLLIKVRIAPKDIATLTAHSKESVASTRSRLYAKVFGQKGSTKDWDDFVLSL
ncbi:MAG: hypothetical protein KAZ98_03395 [Prevotella sp.]|nr:hypothetical protein [Prevotella sp.]